MKLKEYILLLIYVKYWYWGTSKDYPYVKEFDKSLQEKLSEGDKPVIDENYVNIGGYTLRRSKFGFADFALFEYGHDTISPSRLTKIKLDRLIKKELKEKEKQGDYKWRKR